MKKVSRKGKVHPITYDDCLSFLPPTILALSIVLSPEDKLVLAYLISCSSTTTAFTSPSDSTACRGGSIGNEISKNRAIDHPACFSCSCFSCYMSYWVKWDASPNRQVIHDIIDAFEQGSSSLSSSSLLKKNKKDSRKKRSKGLMNRDEKDEVSESVYVDEKLSSIGSGGDEFVAHGGGEPEVGETHDQKSSVRSVLSFLGVKFWSLLLI